MGKRLIGLVFLLASTMAGSAAAQKPPAKPAKASAAPKAPTLAKADAERLKKTLGQGAEGELLAALAELRSLGEAADPLVPDLDALLARGSSSPVIVAACQTAASLGKESTSAVLAPYVLHRSAEIRRAAAAALPFTKGPQAAASLRRALGSPDPALRALAASGLGTLGVRDAVDDLFTVLSHDTPEAALAVARLCNPQQCDRLMGLVGKLKFETLQPAFVPLLLRPSSEVPEENQLRYVDRLRRLATTSATEVLSAALAALPEQASPRLRRALDAGTKGRPAPKETP